MSIHPVSRHVRTAVVAATAVAAGIASALGGVTQAHAGTRYEGRATASGGLIVRTAPSTHASPNGSVKLGGIVPITCQVEGTTVTGSDGRASNDWYLLADADQWVSGRYVDVLGDLPPYCGDGTAFTVKVTTASLTGREGPTTADRARGSYARGTRLMVVCKVDGPAVDGNRLWYNLPNSRWISARYVTAVGPTPEYCTI